ncbi:siderophore-interacting protein [Aliirhizobium smilacinae]|uniref:Siderophore-interacting protein n=1 Tax=Aliirhizobium smilacinae TaxID=1395944 RepID=A0A5C4XTG7_9HYPH|nr:siderophore-interacting protein [Rhizobium smilacinae]TNM66652.1 siderophore-interacting protein [Rhizobium smilacinae]
MDSSSQTSVPSPVYPVIERVRHELKRRELTVDAVDYITPQMLRITLIGEALSDFTSLGTDDHVKLVVPGAGGEMEMRDYTPRSYDNATGRLVLDFAVHEAGPATKWALEARPGTAVTIAGPRGSAVVSGVTKWVLVGDETAIPAIGRRIEEAKSGDVITAIGVVTDKNEEQQFASAAKLTMQWVHRPASAVTDLAPVIAALDGIALTQDTFVWVAAEASVARAIKTYLTTTRNHPLPWLKAAGYWTIGQADSSVKTID